ncbi:hypothetical protein SASPL_106548 [Salvia splendens]|uniref:Uncharacterized protein n=1 Tax=Salvia splendens TaxID=180675 RepID=A0A8X8YNU3_SALSN|nr:hypothetical protein SASPL_106548 [Salvia splendens]
MAALSPTQIVLGMQHFALRLLIYRLIEMAGAEILKATADGIIKALKGDTPLIEAANAGHINVVEFLIIHKAQLQAANKKGFTALHYAVQKDNRDLMELLLNNGAPTEKDSVDGTPLQIAASQGQLKSIKLLLKFGAEPNSNISAVQDSPLISAIKALSYECVKRLIKAKADPDKFLYGLTPLAHAAKLPDTKYLECLIAAGATPHKQCTGRTIAIEEAAMVDNRKAVSILFPLTAKLPGYQTWTREQYKKRYLEVLEGLGNRRRYNEAIFGGRVALFEYFSWLYLTSCPGEVMIYFQHFM